MPTTGLSYRRGMASTLGTIIFVSIIFSAFIPMLLVMKQADILHETRKHEIGIRDEERVSENIIFYTLPLTDPPRLSFVVENRGENLITIERIWLNNISHVVSELIPSMATLSDIGPFSVPDVDETYIIKLSTDRGNVFTPSSGVPTYDQINGEWLMDSFNIFIMMTEPQSQLHILVNYMQDEESIPIEPPVTYFDDDVANNQPGYSISVPLPGQYYVEVTRWHGTPSEEELYPLAGNGLVTLGLTTPTVLIII